MIQFLLHINIKTHILTITQIICLRNWCEMSNTKRILFFLLQRILNPSTNSTAVLAIVTGLVYETNSSVNKVKVIIYTIYVLS